MLAQVLLHKLKVAFKDVYKPRSKLRPRDFGTNGFIQPILRQKNTIYSFFRRFSYFQTFSILNMIKNLCKKAHDLHSHGLTTINQNSKTERRFLFLAITFRNQIRLFIKS